ncbi:phosphoserine phosphatase SerB [archaeon SCG-AAA382B04]|nr:phosphoserine phosphatase SerB [archaeon SCG-AAA382B04]
MKGLVVFDLDSTLIDAEAIDELGKYTNKKQEIEEITQRAMEGELNYKQSLEKRVSKIEGIKRQEIVNLAKNLPLMPGAKKLINELKRMDYSTAIITGSFETVAKTVNKKLGVDHIIANKLVFDEKNKTTGKVTGPLREKGKKGKELKKLLSDLKITNSKCVFAVGDGANDLSMIEVADLGISFNGNSILDQHSDLIIKQKDLTKVLTKIRDKTC